MIKQVTDRPPAEYLVEDLFDTRTVHLIIGPSGAGKTTWTSQIIRDWRIGLPVLGHVSHPKPFCYIALDRGFNDVDTIWRKVGLEKDFPFYLMREQESWWYGKGRWRLVLNDIHAAHPEIRVIFLDGFTSLSPDGNIIDYAVVSQFLLELGAWCERANMTVFGLGHTTKLKMGNEIVQARECAIGSVAWAGYSSSLVKITQTDPTDPDSPLRTVNVQPRGAAPQTIAYTFTSDGVLEMIVPPSPPEDTLVQVLTQFGPGEDIPIDVLAEALKDLPKRSKYNWLERMATEGKLERVRKGVYRVPMVN
jgi:hypothetical protein